MTEEQKKVALNELKVQAYDALANAQFWQQKSSQLNEEIKKLMMTKPEEVE